MLGGTDPVSRDWMTDEETGNAACETRDSIEADFPVHEPMDTMVAIPDPARDRQPLAVHDFVIRIDEVRTILGQSPESAPIDVVQECWPFALRQRSDSAIAGRAHGAK